MTWTDETEANYRKYHKEKFGEYPPEVKFKEGIMPTGETNTNDGIVLKTTTTLEPVIVKDHFFGGLTATEEHAINLPPKRTRRAKGVAQGTSKTIKISGDGHLTVTLTGVSLLELSKVDRDFVFGILDMLDRVTNG